MYVGQRQRGSGGNRWWIVLVIVLITWIVASSIIQRSPLGLISESIAYMKGNKAGAGYSELLYENERKDSLLTELQTALDMLKKSTNYQQAVVNVENDHLNMRSKPVLGSAVVIQLPVGAVVEVLYYDNETFRIGGEYGKWCKVRYSGKEGWVWGNYIKMID